MTSMRPFAGALAAVLLTGCADLGSIASGLGDTLARQPDPEIVRDAAPAYLVMADTFAREAPEDAEAQLAASQLYGAYAGAFVDSAERQRRLTQRAYDYGRTGLCLRLASVCEGLDERFAEFRASLDEVTDEHDARTLYRFATAWAGWVRARSDDFDALADLPRLEATFRRVLAVSPGIDHGNAHAYLGVLLAQRPAALGGDPAEAREQFERALAVDDRNLMAKVLYAQHYARLTFDRELHERLLDEVLAADAGAGDLTLSNALARQRARALRASAEDYF